MTRGRRLVLLLLAVLLLATVLIRACWLDLFYISSGSMEPTVVPGERILVDRTVSPAQLQRGDVIVFDGRGSFAPYEPASVLDDVLRTLHVRGGESTYVKRVLALPGETIACCSPAGKVTVNDQEVSEPYLFPGDVPSLTRFEATVPRGKLWLMGDHRSASSDSRSLIGAPGGGMVSEDRVLGRVNAVVWPLGSIRSIPSTGEQ
ncbi:signal peptidase I [Galactobacter caseinivorans]|uniref:Signal peptidase I n=1 Tax=Galactobacter caseinivorans TaxID=2676123 RepID=A0A496PGV4_9MICC|nr:signal peptidase I [Galactobacter caseinivorans]RKW69711.1 signal peptidase I [Galactobacter caseinivorans]